MAQVLKLKRTSVQGKVPNISNLELGELAVNTYDGRLFFEKDNGTLSIQEILVTNSNVSGSLILNGDITASNLLLTGDSTIDGNLYLGGTIYIGDNPSDTVVVSAEFSGSLIPDGNEYYDLGSAPKKWNNIWVKNINATTLTGNIVSTNGVVSGSSQLTSSFDSRYLNVAGEGNISGSFTGSFTGDGSQLTNLPAADVSQVATVTSSFDNQSTIVVNHSFNSKNVIVSVYDSNYSQIIPQTVTLTDNDTTTIVLSSPNSGHVVVAKGGHIIANEDLTTYKVDVTGNSTYTITHNLNDDYPLVQAWNTFTKRQEQPSDIESLTSSSLQITFSSNFEGKIVVKK